MKKKLEWLELLVPVFFVIVLVIPNLCYGGPNLVKIPESISSEQEEIEENDPIEPRDKIAVGPTKSSKIAKLKYKNKGGNYKDGTYTGSAPGYGGPIVVKVVVESGRIKSIGIVSSLSETPSFFARAKVVANRIVEAQSPKVDVVSGATYSSNGIINAVIAALRQAGGKEKEKTAPSKDAQSKSKPTATRKPTKTLPKNAIYADGSFIGIGQGWGGDIKTRVVVKKGKITNIKLLSAEYETLEYLNKAKAMLATMKNAQTSEVDVISGATYSSIGIRDAVREALAKSIAKQDKKKGKKPKVTSMPMPTKLPTIAPTMTPSVDTEEKLTEDGCVVTVTKTTEEKEVTGTAMCYPDDNYDFAEYSIDMMFSLAVETTITTTTKENEEDLVEKTATYQLTGMRFTQATENLAKKEGNWFFLKNAAHGDGTCVGIFAQIMQKKTKNVDMVSGATCSSMAIVDAYQNAMSKME